MCRWVAKLVAVCLVLIVIMSGGCGAVAPLPESIEVAISEADREEAEMGSGPAGLADTVWSIQRGADPRGPYGGGTADPTSGYGGLLRGEPLARPPPGAQIFVVHFGPDGRIVRVTENEYFLPGIYRTEVPVGGDWVATPLPGVSFRSRSYGLEQDNRYGVAARFQVRFVNMLLAHATVYSWGRIAGDRSDGRFGYTLDFSDGLLAFLGTIADEYPADGELVTP
jgi:hypothetical protein